jgi:hypothetical protein
MHCWYCFDDFRIPMAYYQKSHPLDVLLFELKDLKSLPEIMGLMKYVKMGNAIMRKAMDYNYDYS